MENKHPFILLGTVVLFSVALIMPIRVHAADDTIYSPVNPKQAVTPVEPSRAPESSTSAATSVQPAESSSTVPEKPTPKPTEKPKPAATDNKKMKPKKRKKLYLDHDFFADGGNHVAVLNDPLPDLGGDDPHPGADLTDMVQMLSGVALYGRKK